MAETRKECVQFGKHVRQLRLKRGFSQESFAYQSEINRTFYGRIERGAVNPSLSTIYRIARALKISPGKLLLK